MDQQKSSAARQMRALVMKDYENDYKRDPADSPRETRTAVNRAIMDIVRQQKIMPPRILNIGSGPQLLERVLQQSYRTAHDVKLLKSLFFAAIDIAKIRADKLKARKHANVAHVQADAEALPFAPESFGMVVSNMAIDMMPRTAFSEASQALAKGGAFIFTFHHPDMMRDIAATAPRLSDRAFALHLLQNNLYFATEEEIRSTLAAYSLEAQEIRRDSNAPDNKGSTWWFVRGIKK
ncbi:methyltransferase domain-containing protein [Candidatus Kaiserbacteria bacterium]|nr:methyltransferase domain-containing protein [Candidatus Kaiserbacteria bacterium]